jgi:hypothetical protein
VHAALQSIPEEAVKRGVFPEDTLRERFLKVIPFPLFLRTRVAFGPRFGHPEVANRAIVTRFRPTNCCAIPQGSREPLDRDAIAEVVLRQSRKKRLSRDETTLASSPRR